MKTSILAATLLSVASLQAAPVVILNDQFSDDDRMTQNPPDSSRWYYLGGNGSMSVSNNQLIWDIGTGWATALTYFSSTAISLNAGDTLSASFSLAMDNLGNTPAADSLRIGLFDSGGSRVTGDVPESRYDAVFDNYTGYFGSLNPLSNADNTFYSRRRGDINQSDLFSDSALWLGPSTAGIAFTEGTPLLVAMSIERLESGVRWMISIGDRTYEINDTDSTLFAYDTLAIFVGGPANVAEELLISNVNVTFIPNPVPEPATVALLLVGGGLFLGWQRSRKGNRVSSL